MPRQYRYIIWLDGQKVDLKSDRPLSPAERMQRARAVLETRSLRARTGQPQQPAPPAQNRTIEPMRNARTREVAQFLAASPETLLRGVRTLQELQDRVYAYLPADLRQGTHDPRTRTAITRGVIMDLAQELSKRGTGAAVIDALLRPETLAPQADPTPNLIGANAGTGGVRRVGVIEGAANLLNTPLRALTTALLMPRQGATIGRETGRPTRVGGYAETYAADPNWGSVLEAYAPDTPAWARQVAGLALNIFGDPLNLLGGMGVVGRGADSMPLLQRARKLARGEPRMRPEYRYTRTETRTFGIGTETPTRTRALIYTPEPDPVTGLSLPPMRVILNEPLYDDAPRLSPPRIVQRARDMLTRELPALGFMDRPASANWGAWLGTNLQAAQASRSPLRVLGLALHGLLDPIGLTAAIRERGLRLDALVRDMAQTERLRKLVARGAQPKDALETIAKTDGTVSQAAQAEAERLARLERGQPSTYQKLLSLWKASKTTLNPPSVVRNFLQNFVFRYLEGLPVERVPQAIARLARDPERARQAWARTETPLELQQEARDSPRRLRQVLELAARIYEGGDRLAAVLIGEAARKDPRALMLNYGEIPRVVEALRRSGVAPFIAWQYFAIPTVARGAVDHPARLRQALAAVSTLQPDPDKKGEYIQIGDRELATGSILPISPAEFGGDTPLVEVRNIPLYNLLQGLDQTLGGRGRPQPQTDLSTYNKVADTALMLKDFFSPPWLAYHLPGAIAPRESQLGKRAARTRADYIRGLLGFSTRPVDEAADQRARLREAMQEYYQLRRKELGR